MWAGLFGGPFAWALEHVFGYGLSEAACDPAGTRWGVPFHAWIAIATAVAALLALLALSASVLAFRAVQAEGSDAEPPRGRIWFPSVCGIVIRPLFLAIILLGGIAALLLSTCQQG
jgi:hypothetical protein